MPHNQATINENNEKAKKTVKTVAIIGAGPSGLVSAKQALAYGLKPTVLEKQTSLGGIWHPTTGKVWQGMRTNLSHFSCQFSDFPWKNPTDDFPLRGDVYQYLCHYAKHFSLNKHILFNAQVMSIQKQNDQWAITWQDRMNWKVGETLNPQLFDYLIVASGAFSYPNVPPIPGLSYLHGSKILHSEDYKDSAKFTDQTIVVIGSGFSGTEIAADIATTAKKVHHIFKTPHWILPRNIPVNPTNPLSIKQPVDLVFYNRSRRAQTQEIKFKTPEDNEKTNKYMNSICSAQGQISADLIVPSETWKNPAQVTISDVYLEQVKKKKIEPIKTDKIEFGFTYQLGSYVIANGKKIPLDAVMLCTGYKLILPFFNEDMQDDLYFDEADPLQPLLLYKCTFSPKFNNLAFVGMYRGPYFAVMELQAKWAMAVFANKVNFPSPEQFDIALQEEDKIKKLSPRPQFPHGDYVGLADSIAKELDCLPDFDKLKKENPKLHTQLYNGPVVPAHYNLTIPTLNQQLNDVEAFMARPSPKPLTWGFNSRHLIAAAGVALVTTGLGMYLSINKNKL